MKHLIILCGILLTLISLVGCSSEEPTNPSQAYKTEMADIALENDSLIMNLKSLNDSLYSHSDLESRGLKDIFNFMKLVAVVTADVKGAIDGAKWGGALMGKAGAVVGAIVVGTTCSIIQGFLSYSRANESLVLNQSKVEVAYANARLNGDLLVSEKTICSPIQINVPVKYSNSIEVGLYHNATLRVLSEDVPLSFKAEDGLSQNELAMLHSNEFSRKYDLALNNPNIFSFEYLRQNKTKEDRVVQLFLEAYEEYPTNMTDVNYLINSYIRLIEQDAHITELQKSAVYSALSTAAYSTNYWSTKLND